jgi:hypothetical protein
MGIEPTSEAWEASILPLYDARSTTKLTKAIPSRKREQTPCLQPANIFCRQGVVYGKRVTAGRKSLKSVCARM